MSASSSLPCATSTSPTLSYEIDRSRCHCVLLRSAAARRSADGEAVAVGLERLLELALRHQHVADLSYETDRSRCHCVLLRIGGGEALDDGEAVAVGLERLLELALRHQHVADLVVRDPIDRATGEPSCSYNGIEGSADQFKLTD